MSNQFKYYWKSKVQRNLLFHILCIAKECHLEQDLGELVVAGAAAGQFPAPGGDGGAPLSAKSSQVGAGAMELSQSENESDDEEVQMEVERQRKRDKFAANLTVLLCAGCGKGSDKVSSIHCCTNVLMRLFLHIQQRSEALDVSLAHSSNLFYFLTNAVVEGSAGFQDLSSSWMEFKVSRTTTA